jgi:hypothetical protein
VLTGDSRGVTHARTLGQSELNLSLRGAVPGADNHLCAAVRDLRRSTPRLAPADSSRDPLVIDDDNPKTVALAGDRAGPSVEDSHLPEPAAKLRTVEPAGLTLAPRADRSGRRFPGSFVRKAGPTLTCGQTRRNQATPPGGRARGTCRLSDPTACGGGHLTSPAPMIEPLATGGTRPTRACNVCRPRDPADAVGRGRSS